MTRTEARTRGDVAAILSTVRTPTLLALAERVTDPNLASMIEAELRAREGRSDGQASPRL